MPYDSNLDNQIFSKAWEKENQKIVVSVWSYNNGPKKLQIIRENIEANPGKVQEMMHERALKTLCARGYVFGQKEDSNIKTSNIMVRFCDLPLEQKAKIAIVYQTIASLVRLP